MKSKKKSHSQLVNKIRRNGTLLFLLILLGSGNLYAQRLEAHISKDVASNAIAMRSWGGGASFIVDEWVKRVDFQINYDYAQYNSGKVERGVQVQYARHKVGLSALYVFPFKNPHFLFRVGGDIAYNSLKKVYTIKNDSIPYYCETHRGDMLSIGPVGSFQIKVGQKDFFRIGFTVIPAYLIPLHYKVDRDGVEPEFKKGFFDMQLQLGIEFRLGGTTGSTN